MMGQACCFKMGADLQMRAADVVRMTWAMMIMVSTDGDGVKCDGQLVGLMRWVSQVNGRAEPCVWLLISSFSNYQSKSN